MERPLSSAAKAVPAVALSLSLYHLLRWPIALGDTDVWYHLHTGREMWRTWRIPADTAFFSFIDPPRRGVDIWWLFQALLYPVQARAGWFGLIALKAAAFAAMGLCVARYARRAFGAWDWRAALVCGLYAAVLIVHFKLMRPQVFTLAFMAAFLLILEFEPEKSWLLPVLALLWCNLHGIFYPVLLILLGAHAADHLLDAARKRQPRHPVALGWVALAMACVYLTPGGWRLLGVPFTTLAAANEFIGDLAPLNLQTLTSFGLQGPGLSTQALFNLLLWGSCLAAGRRLRQGPAKPRHLLLWLAGLLLLTRGARFMFYSALLFLPLLADALSGVRLEGKNARLAALVLACLPLFSIGTGFERRPKYPYSEERLPRGVAAYLNRAGTGGKVLNHPNGGGFLEWALAPSYKIYMDMRVPALFTDEDFLLTRGAFLDPDLLAPILDRYHPAFITVPLAATGFPDVLRRFPDFVLVFFDDAEALYANRRQAAKLAEGRLRSIDPFHLAERLHPGPPGSPFRKELARLIEIDPHCLTTRQLAGEIAIADLDPAAALVHARALAADFPEYPAGRRLEAAAKSSM